jgi:hypothetical protein
MAYSTWLHDEAPSLLSEVKPSFCVKILEDELSLGDFGGTFGLVFVFETRASPLLHDRNERLTRVSDS